MSQDKLQGQDQSAGAPAPGSRLFGRRPNLQSPNEALQPESAPPPPPGPPPSKRRPTLSAISGFMSFLLVAAFGAVIAFAYMQHQLNAPGPLAADKVAVIAKGADRAEIVGQLESEGVIGSGLLLNAALIVEGTGSRLRAGEFLFKKNASLREVIDTLVSGKQILHSITIPEGLTSEQILQRLKDNEFLSGDIRETPREGTLLPDTYRVSRGMSRADLIVKMQSEQKRILDQVWAGRSADLPVRSPFELLTLASIVEKETGRADERPHVASVFINRLGKRMKLQSDPTIVYGLVGGRGTLGRGILRSEVERATPYNTYVIEGLPPGPIANPGRAALDAVARPSRTKDLFFVADGTGGHAFAETLDQHSRNVTRWRQLEKDTKERQQAPAAAPVDRVQPEIGPPGAPTRDQRGDLDNRGIGSFGSLPVSFGATALAGGAEPPAPRVDAPPAASAAKTIAAAAIPAKAAPEKVPPQRPAAAGAFALGPALDEKLVAGLMDPQLHAPGNALDGPANDADAVPADTGAVPVSAARRAEQKARAARFGLAAGSDELPLSAYAEQERPAAAPMVAQAGDPMPKIIRIFDASEGTALDPLKDKSWDLNSPKTVPEIRAESQAPGKPAARAKKPL